MGTLPFYRIGGSSAFVDDAPVTDAQGEDDGPVVLDFFKQGALKASARE